MWQELLGQTRMQTALIGQDLLMSTHFSGIGAAEIASDLVSAAARRVSCCGRLKMVQMIEKALAFNIAPHTSQC